MNVRTFLGRRSAGLRAVFVQQLLEYLSSTHTKVHRFGLSPQSPANSLCTPPGRLLYSIVTFALWIHSSLKIFPKSQMSSSESSSLEKQTQEKHPSSREFATPPTVQRSTVLIHRAHAIGYVLVPSGAFDLIVQPD
jgi:hypothetical protein